MWCLTPGEDSINVVCFCKLSCMRAKPVLSSHQCLSVRPGTRESLQNIFTEWRNSWFLCPNNILCSLPELSKWCFYFRSCSGQKPLTSFFPDCTCSNSRTHHPWLEHFSLIHALSRLALLPLQCRRPWLPSWIVAVTSSLILLLLRLAR